VPLVISGDRTLSEDMCELIRVLGKFSECRVVQDEKFPKDTSTELAAGYRLTLEIQIDKEVELRLLNDQITKARQNLERESAKLKNQGFMAKAPKEVVEEVRKRIAELDKNIEELNQSIGMLSTN
jgi:valyl-tRNA synthetase